MTRNYFTYSILVLGLCLSGVSYAANSQNTELKQILSRAFAKDPELLEAKANTMIAHSQTEQAISGHYPTISVFGRQSLEDYSRYNTNDRNNKFTPGAQANLLSERLKKRSPIPKPMKPLFVINMMKPKRILLTKLRNSI